MDYDKRMKLRKLAEEATPGPWHDRTSTIHQDLSYVGHSWDKETPWEKDMPALVHGGKWKDNEFIAKCDPQTILALLNYIDELENDLSVETHYGE